MELGGLDKSGCSGGLEKIIGSKSCASDGRIYDTETTEEKDLKFIAENTCMVCGKRFKKGEIKILPPEAVQQQDFYVRTGIVSKRYMCVSCHERMTSDTREKIKSEYRESIEGENKIIKTLVEGMLKPREVRV